MYHNAAIVVLLATLVTKAAGYATLPVSTERMGFDSVKTATESNTRVVPDTCELDFCPCSQSTYGCDLRGQNAVPRDVLDVDDINYCWDYCFADGDLYKSSTDGQAPCYSKCKGASIFWQEAACSATYQLQTQVGSVFYDAEKDGNTLCPAEGVSGDFCEEYDENKIYKWVRPTVEGGSGANCHRAMKNLRLGQSPEDPDKEYACAGPPFDAECSEKACHSLLWMGPDSMNGGIAYFCQYNEDNGRCERPPTNMQVDTLEGCEFEQEARRKLQAILAKLRK